MATKQSKEVRQALKAIAKLIVELVEASMAVMDLEGSNLEKSLETSIRGGDTIILYMAEYGQWVVSGRRKFVKKVPISALLEWIKRKNIQPIAVAGKTISINSLAFAIQTSIFKNGIKPRDFIEPALGDEFLNLAEAMLLDALEAEIDEVLELA